MSTATTNELAAPRFDNNRYLYLLKRVKVATTMGSLKWTLHAHPDSKG